MSYYSEKRLRFFNDSVEEEILDRLDRIELALAKLLNPGGIQPQMPLTPPHRKPE